MAERWLTLTIRFLNAFYHPSLGLVIEFEVGSKRDVVRYPCESETEARRLLAILRQGREG